MTGLLQTAEITGILHGAAAEANGDAVLEIVNPSDGSVLGSVRESSAADVDLAVRDARAAAPGWAAKTPAERTAALFALADAVEARIDEFARLEAVNAGKPWSATREHELPGTIDALRHFAALGRVAVGQPAGDYVEGFTSYLRREPLGVVAAITPWNFPLWQAVWKIAPALAVGNTVVVKPSELTPLSTVLLATVAAEILPPGVLNLVNGRGETTGHALVSHPEVDAISFTGSTRAGRAIAATAAAGPKRVVLELGGNAPVVVFDDADIDSAAEWLAATSVYNAGQECMAATRMIVHEDVHDRFVAAVVARLQSDTVLGDALDHSTTLGPLISETQLARVQDLIDRLPASASVVTGGAPAEGPGFFYPPTIVTGVSQHDEIVQAEIFGPVATVQRFSDEAEAIALANGVEQGLAGSVWTRDLARAHRVVNALEVGNVWVNAHMASGIEMPVGGFHASGYGKEGGLAGLDEFARTKQITISLGRPATRS